jgi:hypothetical protein
MKKSGAPSARDRVFEFGTDSASDHLCVEPCPRLWTSRFPFLSVLFSEEPAWKLFCAFSDTLLSEYNLFLVLEQVTTCSRVPENGELIRHPGTSSGFSETGTRGCLGSWISITGEPIQIPSFRFFEERIPKNRNLTKFRVPENQGPT